MAEASALQYAIQLERDGQAFYAQVAATTRNPLGGKMFESLAADERRHEQVLVGIAGKMNVALDGDMPKERLVTLFAAVGEQWRADLGAEASDTAAVEKALEMEAASIAHYRTEAARAAGERERALYARLVEEEEQHADILRNCLTYLNRTGQWFLWDEKGLLDGG
ncbi:MAG TPA: ferritin family protein [Planctomycetota bacterium]|nr:ferritin family protein [Planctomycetota bacterium]